MLAMTDIHLVIQKKGAADAVLPSKLTNILSAGGHALITAEEHTELGQIAENHPGIYSLVEPENIDKFVASLTALLSSDLTEHNRIARNYANEYLAKNKVINNFSENIRSLLDS